MQESKFETIHLVQTDATDTRVVRIAVEDIIIVLFRDSRDREEQTVNIALRYREVGVRREQSVDVDEPDHERCIEAREFPQAFQVVVDADLRELRTVEACKLRDPKCR